jgi:uncharacterized protein (DUF885 family)
MSELDRIAREYLEDISRLDPLSALERGDLRFASGMTDFSPEGETERAELAIGARRKVEESLQATDSDGTAGAAMTERLGIAIDLFEAGEWMRGLSVFGPQLQIRQTFVQMPTTGESDWLLIADKLSAVPEAMLRFRRSVAAGLAEGPTVARRQVLACAAQTRNWSGGGAGPGFFTTLVQAYRGGDSKLAERLTELGRQADSAYLDFTIYLEKEYAPLAKRQDGVGRERYQLYCRQYNGLELDLEETYSFGWEELARIEAEMGAVADRIVPGGGVDAAAQLLDQDPARAIEGADNFLAWNQEFLDRTMAELAGTHFDIPTPVRRVEAMIAPPGGNPAMYYTPPSSDFTRPGRTWYPTLGRTRFPLWREVSVAYHEGVPGHHLQLAQTCFLEGTLPPFQTLLGGVSGHVEGWALYAERLMGELGYLENPDYYLGMLAAHAFRAARVVVDIGLHLDKPIPADQSFHPGKRWSFDLAVAFLMERGRVGHDFALGEVHRYLGVPAQAISYKVGERAWLEVRETARRNWGPQFELKEFHRRALNLGCVGLDQLRRELERPLPA